MSGPRSMPGDSDDKTRDEILQVLAERSERDRVWVERTMAAAMVMGASVRQVADAAGVPHSTAARIAKAHRLGPAPERRPAGRAWEEEKVEPVFLSAWPDAARALGVGRTTVFDLMTSGRLESVRIGRRRLVPVAALRAFAAELEGGQQP